MNLAIATLVAFAVAALMAAVRFGRAARRTEPLSGESAPSQPRRWKIARLRRTSRTVQPAALAAWADDLARALRHGSTLHAALAHTLPADPIVEHRSASLRHWLGRGATVADACDEWSDELTVGTDNHADRVELLATMAAVLAATATLGGAAAAPLDRLAVSMRQRASDDLERAAQSAQAQMSAKVLTSVPLAVLALLLVTDAAVRSAVASLAGGTLVALGIGLNAVGALWMKRIADGGRRTA